MNLQDFSLGEAQLPLAHSFNYGVRTTKGHLKQ